MTIQQARKIVHAPEAFTKKLVREAVQFIQSHIEADGEDLFWAGVASIHRRRKAAEQSQAV